MTDYEKSVIYNQEQQIKLTGQRLWEAQQAGDRAAVNRLQRTLAKLQAELKEYQELFTISHLETCIDLDGNILPSKAAILKENEEDESTKPIYYQSD